MNIAVSAVLSITAPISELRGKLGALEQRCAEGRDPAIRETSYLLMAYAAAAR